MGSVSRAVRRGSSPPPSSRARRLVLAGLFQLVRLFLGLVHGTVGVLRRPVDRVEDQGVLAGVDEVVLPAGGHDGQVALRDLALLARDDGLTGAADEGEDL